MYIIVRFFRTVKKSNVISTKKSYFLHFAQKGAIRLDILDRIIELLRDDDQKKLTDYLHLKKTAFTDWKSGRSNSYRKYLIEIAEFFGVSIDYLVYGNNHFSSNIKNSTIGAIGNHSTGTISITNDTSDKEKPSPDDEMVKEIARILNELPIKERTKLLSMIYDFEEDYKKNSK